jgi:hypothetical protein
MTPERVTAFAARMFWPLMCACWIVSPLQSQSRGAIFHGRVTTDSGRTAVEGVEVQFSARSVRSDSAGRYRLFDLEPGKYSVVVRHPRFRPITGDVTLAEGDSIQWNFDLVLVNVALDPVVVSGRGDPLGHPGLVDFQRRKETTHGKFLTGEEIERIGAQTLESVIRTRIPGFDFVKLPNGGTGLAGKRAGQLTLQPRAPRVEGLADRCYAQVYVNGQLIYRYRPPPDRPPSLEDFNPKLIRAIEFYRGPSDTPPELNSTGSSCGTMVIWMDIPGR